MHPPFQSARIWIKNSKIDVDFLKMNKPLFSTSYGGAAKRKKEEMSQLLCFFFFKQTTLPQMLAGERLKVRASPVLKFIFKSRN